ncbi:hypothetical protein TNCV_3647931 [Trichonephila clavipes]|nr:hypothetical protein TNCV_3647931 [Trichonephila clavipes]
MAPFARAEDTLAKEGAEKVETDELLPPLSTFAKEEDTQTEKKWYMKGRPVNWGGMRGARFWNTRTHVPSCVSGVGSPLLPPPLKCAREKKEGGLQQRTPLFHLGLAKLKVLLSLVVAIRRRKEKGTKERKIERKENSLARTQKIHLDNKRGLGLLSYTITIHLGGRSRSVSFEICSTLPFNEGKNYKWRHSDHALPTQIVSWATLMTRDFYGFLFWHQIVNKVFDVVHFVIHFTIGMCV